MVKARVIIGFAVFFLVCGPGRSVNADLIINEVMANEPGSQVTLEWIEIFNNSDSVKSLSNYTLEINGTLLLLPDDVITGGQYYILCRRFATSGTVPGFEEIWGNNTGVWGDDLSKEFYPINQLTAMSLTNDTGQIILRFGGSTKSSFVWNQNGADGVSWERFSPTSATISNSTDPRGGTPGEMNSITPRRNDLSLVSLSAYPAGAGGTTLRFTVANSGTDEIASSDLKFYYDLDRDSVVNEGDLITTYSLFNLSPYDTIEFSDVLTLEGIYPTVLAQLPDDERPENNIKSARATGEEFPPLIINEFMPYPRPPLSSEWVEIKNRTDSTIDLAGWKVGDSLRLNLILSGARTLEAGEYLILAQDSAAFRAFYGDNAIPVVQPSSWGELNNGVDQVRLYDSSNFPADSFRYGSVYPDNYSWSRGEEAGKTEQWGRSIEPGGTPGKMNQVYYQASASAISLKVEPNPFSPSRDRQTAITFSMPPGENMTIRIYDTEGRLVKTILDNMPALDGVVYWDGKSDDNLRLQVGIYIIYAEVHNRAQFKQTVVIAP